MPIGVLTVQSFLANAYNRFHVSILQTIASYTSIALQNVNAFTQLDDAKKTIESKSRNILDSIRYAERIQNAVLPNVGSVTKHFAENFILYKPKDIVSGDFYWFRGTDKYAIVIVADCTGHGVPGAFMSMIGSILFDELINRKRLLDPAKILHELHIAVRNSLQQQTTSNTDGMDVCLCYVTKGEKANTKDITFAGAKRPLYVVKSGEFEQVGGDRKSIGGRQREAERIFTNKTLTLSKGDMIYLTSDGYADQNDEGNNKYGNKKFKETLAQIANLSTEEQNTFLSNELKTFQGSKSQRDDITVIGFKM